MIDREGVTPADRREHRRDHVLGDVINALAARAHEMVVVFWVAGDICRDVTLTLEAAGHPILHLLLERAVDGGAADGRMCRPNALVQLLRR